MKFKHYLKKGLFYGAFILLLLTLATWWQSRNLRNVDISETIQNISVLEQKPVVMRFISETCGICLLENDNIDRAYQWAGVNTVNIMVGDVSTNDYFNYLNKHNLDSQKSIQDKSYRLFSSLGGKGVPMTLYIDEQGIVKQLTVGYTSTIGLIIRYYLMWF